MTPTTTAVPANGRARKSLAHQIDRLDAILDGLAEALNGAVADAVRDAVGAAVADAVRAVLTEVLTNPDLAGRLAERVKPADRPGPTWRDRLRSAGRWVLAAATTAAGWLARQAIRLKDVAVRRASAAAAGLARRYRVARAAVATATALVAAFRRRLAVVLAAGVLVGVGCYLAGPVVASAAGGLGGAAAAALAPVAVPLWRVWRSLDRPA